MLGIEFIGQYAAGGKPGDKAMNASGASGWTVGSCEPDEMDNQSVGRKNAL